MRLVSMRLHNFRQFYGESPRILFASGDKNVTVFHGCNGSGKTALLNAFTWVLYGIHTRGFQLPDQLVNKRAIRQAKTGEAVVAFVELCFEHDRRNYVLRRQVSVHKCTSEPGWDRPESQAPTLQWCGEDGRWLQEDRVEDAIGRILPVDLHSYFFFDGERIERIVQPTKTERADIANATKKFLGIEILERAERHLRNALRELERELEQIGDPETVRELQEKSRHEADLEKKRAENKSLAKEIDSHRQRKVELERRLRELEGVKAFQMRRDQLNHAKLSREDSLRQGRQRLAVEVSSNAYGVFLVPLAEKFTSLIEELRKRGEIPAGIKRQFVCDLLDAQKCICGEPLLAGSQTRQCVEAWMARAGLADVEEAAIRMGGEVAKLKQVGPAFWGRIDDIQRHREDDRKELAKIESELQDIADKLKNSPQEEVSGLQRQLENVEQAIQTANRAIGANELAMKALSQHIDRLQHDITRHQNAETQQRLIQQRIQATDDAAGRIAEVRDLLEQEFRSSLAQRIRRLFTTISYTPYIPEITPDYSLRLLEAAGGQPLPVAASQGESQILSLAFIGSIIEQARDYHAKRERLPGPDSSSFPMVMDSPFGSLDPVYRKQIAEHIPRLADQVVMMVTQTQWRGEVEQAAAQRVGRSYVLTYYSPRDDIAPDRIVVGGRAYELFKQSPNDFEYTEIREVPNG